LLKAALKDYKEVWLSVGKIKRNKMGGSRLSHCTEHQNYQILEQLDIKYDSTISFLIYNTITENR